MSEERTQYTVHPDVAIRLDVAERHIKQLESTNDGLTMVMGRHADTITAQRERIAELENANVAMSERIRYLNTIGSVFRTTVREQSETINEMSVSIAELEAALHDTTAQLATATETIARLEADNRRLRHLDAMPVDAMERYYNATTYMSNAAHAVGYTPQMYDKDSAEIGKWLDSRDGAA